jgi:glucose-1-phosphate thymidylyltransferase
MKGLILCAGKGTRLYPFTLSYPKALIPVGNKPLLQFTIEKLAKHGITEIGIVIHPLQDVVIKEHIGSGEQWGVSITYIYQPEPKGISDAVKAAQHFIGTEPFMLLLGDNLILDSLTELIKPIETQGCHVALMVAEVEDPQDYGIAEVLENRIVSLQEKPSSPKSNLAVLGAYSFTPTVFNAVAAIKPSPRGELEITDAIQWLIDQGYPVSYYLTEKPNIDVGTLERWHEANRMVLDEVRETDYIHETAVLDNCQIIPPVLVDHGCLLKDCVIGPYVSISAGSNIEGCRIENTIILNEVHLKHIANPIKNTVIGFRSAFASFHSSQEVEDR